MHIGEISRGSKRLLLGWHSGTCYGYQVPTPRQVPIKGQILIDRYKNAQAISACQRALSIQIETHSTELVSTVAKGIIELAGLSVHQPNNKQLTRSSRGTNLVYIYFTKE